MDAIRWDFAPHELLVLGGLAGVYAIVPDLGNAVAPTDPALRTAKRDTAPIRDAL